MTIFVLPIITSLIAGNRAWIYGPIANLVYIAELGLNDWSLGTFRSDIRAIEFYIMACIAIVVGQLMGLLLTGIGEGRKQNADNSVLSPVLSDNSITSKFRKTREYWAVAFLVVGSLIRVQFSIITISPAWLLFMFVLPGYTSLIAGRRAWIYGPLTNVIYFAMSWLYAEYSGDIRTPSDHIASLALAGVMILAGEIVGLLIEALWWLRKKKG